MLIPGGHTVGIKAYAQGLVVTGVEKDSPAEKAGLRQGDILQGITSVEQLRQRMMGNGELSLPVLRGNEKRNICFRPTVMDGKCHLGAYVRDSVTGIGTVTYYDAEEGAFGALGHGISDFSGTATLPINGGEVVSSAVREVVRGVSGTAGRLKGEFDTSNTLGVILKNTDKGIFGTADAPNGEPIPMAQCEEVHTGKAVIYSNVQADKVETYDIEIVKCYDKKQANGRDMLIRITDADLLKTTGGIVQGMSGSPIIQDGKLVGAVTHVLVNDPTRGYGIFIENMLNAAA
jgi:stage IV sporulation protein B